MSDRIKNYAMLSCLIARIPEGGKVKGGLELNLYNFLSDRESEIESKNMDFDFDNLMINLVKFGNVWESIFAVQRDGSDLIMKRPRYLEDCNGVCLREVEKEYVGRLGDEFYEEFGR